MNKVILSLLMLLFVLDTSAEQYQGAPGIFMGPPKGEDGRPIQHDSSTSWESWLTVALIIIFYATAETLKEVIPARRNRNKIISFQSLKDMLSRKETFVLYLRSFGAENIVGQNDVTAYGASINMPSHYARNIEKCIFSEIDSEIVVALGSANDMADTPIANKYFVSNDDWWEAFVYASSRAQSIVININCSFPAGSLERELIYLNKTGLISNASIYVNKSTCDKHEEFDELIRKAKISNMIYYKVTRHHNNEAIVELID